MQQLRELMDMTGRVAIITGGAGHIGMAMAEALAELGTELLLLDIEEERLRKSVEFLSSIYDTRLDYLVVDLEQTETLKTVAQTVQERFGRLDVLINNAAFVGTKNMEGWVTKFEQQSVSTWRRAIEINLTSVFALTQICAEQLRSSGHGSVINISSIYGKLGPDLSLYEGTNMGNPAAYAASKGGISQFTRWLSTVLAPNVRVNTISPGGLERGQPLAFQERYISRTPLRRMATEEDFKGVVAFLASDMSSYVTGQDIMVDGGWGAW